MAQAYMEENLPDEIKAVADEKLQKEIAKEYVSLQMKALLDAWAVWLETDITIVDEKGEVP